MVTKDPILNQFKRLSSCRVSDALDKLKIAGWVKDVYPVTHDGSTVVGEALTVKTIPYSPRTTSSKIIWGDIIDLARQGSMIVISMGKNVSSWGEILSFAAEKKGVSGTVTDGAVRDVYRIRELGYPVFAAGKVPISAKLRFQVKEINKPITCGGIKVKPGDLVLGDASGVVVVPKERAEDVLKVAREIAKVEARIEQDFEAGFKLGAAQRKHGYMELTKSDK